jgi:hypothetical protein
VKIELVLNLKTAKSNATQHIRPVLRHVDDHVRGAFPLAVDRARAALGRWLQIRRVNRAGSALMAEEAVA